MAPKLMLDSHVADALLAEPTLKAKLDALQAAGVIELVKTYVQDAEHDATPEATKPARAQALRSAFSTVDETAPTLFVLDRPNLDVALFGGPDEHGLYDDVHQENAKYIDDGIIAATALTTCDVLVTDDQRLHRKVRASGAKLAVWSLTDLTTFADTEHSKL
jgi:hypothetical protein